MRRITAIAAALVFLCAGVGFAETRPNFSGTWVLDLARSDVGGAKPPEANGKSVTLVIRHSADALSLERRVGDARPEVATLRLDGGESVNKTPSGADVRTKSTWVGATLARHSVMELKGGKTVESDDVMSLSADGKTMTIDMTQHLPRGDVKRKLVYKKQ